MHSNADIKYRYYNGLYRVHASRPQQTHGALEDTLAFPQRPHSCMFKINADAWLSKITERRYVLVLPMKNAPVYQCFTLGTLKNLVCHVWWALQYLALLSTNRN